MSNSTSTRHHHANSTPVETPHVTMTPTEELSHRVITRTSSAPTGLRLQDHQTLLHHRLPKTGKYGASLMLFKAIVGAGLFALPYATRLMGIGGVTISMFVSGWLCYNCSIVLIRVHDVVVRDTLQRDLTYVSLTQHCFGPTVARLVYGLMVFTALGSLGAYLVLIGNTLATVVPEIGKFEWSCITAAAILPFTLTSNTRFLKFTSIAGNIGVALVVISVLAEGARVTPGIQPVDNYGPHFRTDTFMQAFGIVLFVWSCTTTVITVEKSMAKRSDFAPAFTITTWVVFFMATLFGIVNFLYFGQDTFSIIVLNLGDGVLAKVAKIAIAIDLSFSYPLAMAASREIVEKSLLTDATPHLEWKRKIIRTVMVGITLAICLFPQFNIILNIVGGWSASVLSFILPPLMLLQVRKFHLTAYAAQLQYLKKHHHHLHGIGGTRSDPNTPILHNTTGNHNAGRQIHNTTKPSGNDETNIKTIVSSANSSVDRELLNELLSPNALRTAAQHFQKNSKLIMDESGINTPFSANSTPKDVSNTQPQASASKNRKSSIIETLMHKSSSKDTDVSKEGTETTKSTKKDEKDYTVDYHTRKVIVMNDNENMRSRTEENGDTNITNDKLILVSAVVTKDGNVVRSSATAAQVDVVKSSESGDGRRSSQVSTTHSTPSAPSSNGNNDDGNATVTSKDSTDSGSTGSSPAVPYQHTESSKLIKVHTVTDIEENTSDHEDHHHHHDDPEFLQHKRFHAPISFDYLSGALHVAVDNLSRLHHRQHTNKNFNPTNSKSSTNLEHMNQLIASVVVTAATAPHSEPQKSTSVSAALNEATALDTHKHTVTKTDGASIRSNVSSTSVSTIVSSTTAITTPVVPTDISRVDVRLHGHMLHLPSTRSSFDVLSSTRETQDTVTNEEIKRSNSLSRDALRKLVPHETPIIEENENDGGNSSNRTSTEPTPIASSSGSPTPVSDTPYVPSENGSDSTTTKNTGITSIKHNTHQHRIHTHHHNVLVNIHSIVEYFSHGPHRTRHVKALHLLGVGSSVETIFLYLVTLFGVAVLIFTTVSSILSIVEG